MTEVNPQNIYGFSAPSLDGHEVPLAEYKGKVVVAWSYSASLATSSADRSLERRPRSRSSAN
jgi:hypothetical protein